MDIMTALRAITYVMLIAASLLFIAAIIWLVVSEKRIMREVARPVRWVPETPVERKLRRVK